MKLEKQLDQNSDLNLKIKDSSRSLSVDREISCSSNSRLVKPPLPILMILISYMNPKFIKFERFKEKDRAAQEKAFGKEAMGDLVKANKSYA
jgi:hypothetical protein